jgi:hypothetical protein
MLVEPDEETTLACTDQLIALVETEELPWFAALTDVNALFDSSISPLTSRDRAALLEDRKRDEARWGLSERLLGLAHP